MAQPPLGCSGGQRRFFGLDQRNVHEMFAQEPGLKFIGPEHLKGPLSWGSTEVMSRALLLSQNVGAYQEVSV